MQQVVIQKRFRLATGVDTGALRSSLQYIDVQLEGWKLASRDKQESRATIYGEAFVSVHGHRRTEKRAKCEKNAARCGARFNYGHTNPLETHSLGIGVPNMQRSSEMSRIRLDP